MPGTLVGDALLRRHFTRVSGAFGPREVHYRRGGQGPVVLLLHQSPQSSREMEPLIRKWARHFTLIAPDSPGYGFSTGLQRNGSPLATASIEDYARATLELADALGIGRFGIYGFHTGASIGTALAAGHPDRVTAVAANGLVVLTEAERTMILRDYLPPVTPRWDGGHLAWLWGRMREQTIFFPWHDRRAETRMSFDVPPADRLQAGLDEFLAAGDRYHVAYAAAFNDRAERRLPGLKVPLLVTAAARDPLAGHLDRIGERSPAVQIVPAADAATALDQACAHLRSHPGDGPPPAPTAAPAVPAGPGVQTSEYRGPPGAQVRILRSGSPNSGRRAILLHAPGRSAAALGSLALAIAPHAEVLAVDLPGHGASDPAPAATDRGGALLGSVARLAAALGPPSGGTTTSVVTVGSSGPAGLELAALLGSAPRVVLLDPPAWSPDDVGRWLQDGLPPIVPAWHGGHLLEAWHLVRDSRLFVPWFRREAACARPGEPDLDDRSIHEEVRDLLRSNGAWQALLRDALVYRRAPGVPVIELQAPPRDWATILQ